ncbi:hypothetical protein niasHS_015210 [Heterodera schachtii]|uniref:Uncharacterized protein n=1 Tax=Heterodera schachtii TaxID=97005 RepID=A0ABD2IA27_HETSC
MERQRTSSERSISSADSWELVKIDDREKEEVSVPFPVEDTKSSTVSDQLFIGRKISAESPLIDDHFVGSAESPMDDKLSAENSNCSSDNEQDGLNNSWSAEMANGAQIQAEQQPNGKGRRATARRSEGAQNGNTKLSDPVGLMTVLFCAMTITALLSIIKNFSLIRFNLPSNYSAGTAEEKAIGSESVELLHEFYANCQSQLEDYKVAFAANLDALKRLQSAKMEHKKTIRKLQAEVAKLKIAVRSSASAAVSAGDSPLPLLPPPAISARQNGDQSQRPTAGEVWESKRANARTEYRWRRFLDNYSTPSIGTFGTKFTKWLFDRAALRQKRRKFNSSKQNYYRHKSNVHDDDDDDENDEDGTFDGHGKGGGWRWFEQRHKIRAKLRALCNKFEYGAEDCFGMPTWDNLKKKFQQFVMGDVWLLSMNEVK